LDWWLDAHHSLLHLEEALRVNGQEGLLWDLVRKLNRTSLLLLVEEMHGHSEHGLVDSLLVVRVDQLIDFVAHWLLHLGLLHDLAKLHRREIALASLIEGREDRDVPLELLLLDVPRRLLSLLNHVSLHHLLLFHGQGLLTHHLLLLLGLVDRGDQRVQLVKGINVQMVEIRQSSCDLLSCRLLLLLRDWLRRWEGQRHGVEFRESDFEVEANRLFRRLYAVLRISYESESEVELITHEILV